jgi:septal ring factor EnvC (AmiA/AmiB activator)
MASRCSDSTVDPPVNPARVASAASEKIDSCGFHLQVESNPSAVLPAAGALRAKAKAGSLLAALVAAVTLSAMQPAAPQPQRGDPSQRAAERIRALQREADALATEESALLVQLRRFEVERQLRIEELGQIERDRASTQQTLVATEARAATLKRTAETERPEIEQRLVRVYKLGQAGFWRLLLDVDNLRSAGRAYRTAAALTRIDRDRVIDHQRTLEALGREQQDLRRRIAQIAALETKARAARAAADKAVAARTALVASIDARRDLNAQLTGELQTAQQRLQASVDQLGTKGVQVVLPLKAFQGALPWPARGRMLARFGQTAGIRNGAAVVWNGVEIAVLEGQAVRAVHEGTVAFAGPFTGYGNLVIVEHANRTHSLYGYLSSFSVSKGDRVEAQGPLGAAGLDPSGNAGLYFELRVDGKPVDPLQWMARE